jgi:hypothetical protein
VFGGDLKRHVRFGGWRQIWDADENELFEIFLVKQRESLDQKRPPVMADNDCLLDSNVVQQLLQILCSAAVGIVGLASFNVGFPRMRLAGVV